MHLTTTLLNPSSPLHRCAGEVRAERAERYRTELTQLLAKCAHRGYAREAELVSEELTRLTMDADAPTQSCDFAELFRMRTRYVRDVRSIEAHLPAPPAQSFRARPSRVGILSRIHGLLFAIPDAKRLSSVPSPTATAV